MRRWLAGYAPIYACVVIEVRGNESHMMRTLVVLLHQTQRAHGAAAARDAPWRVHGDRRGALAPGVAARLRG